MSFVEISSKALSDDAPCGPDPDLSADFLNFVAAADARLPTSFINRKDSQLELEQSLTGMKTFFGQHRDIRLLVLAAKYEILSNKAAGFCDAIIAAAGLVTNHWEHFHPAGGEDGHMLRSVILGGLDDMPTVVLPLQIATLVANRRLGAISYRIVLVANKQAKLVAEEVLPDLTSAHEALLKDDFDATKAAYQMFSRTADALKAIRGAFAGQESVPAFDRLEEVVSGICGFLGKVVEEREPKAAPAIVETEAPDASQSGDEAAPAASGGEVLASADAAAAVLQAVESYFARFEPSNPALLVVRLARQVQGQSFVDVLQMLTPATAANMSVKIAGEWPMTLNFDQLKALSVVKSEVAAPANVPDAKPVEILTRQRAVSAMLDVETFYRKNEPSSPVPFLLDKARRFTGADFRELLRDILNQTV